jgi:hypothetical protein
LDRCTIDMFIQRLSRAEYFKKVDLAHFATAIKFMVDSWRGVHKVSFEPFINMMRGITGHGKL